MSKKHLENTLWILIFFSLVLGYALFYAPFGVNETDGGFLTGLSWQVLQGKILYRDLVYVRPPLPVWLRALELQYLPERYGVLGERWIFYLKVGMYSWLGAALLYDDKQRWILATFGFIVSAHCYPAMAWHTVDGILFSVLAVYLFFQARNGLSSVPMLVMAGCSLLAAVLCKQSFYPLIPFLAVVTGFLNGRKMLTMFTGFALATVSVVYYFYTADQLTGFMKMTGGAASGGQAIRHGIIDYGMITPELAIPSLVLAIVGFWQYRKGRSEIVLAYVWGLWLLALVASFGVVVWMRQEHTAPFAQTRFLFDLAVAYVIFQLYRINVGDARVENARISAVLLLLSITWCAAISWGYSLPIMFSTPWVWTAMEISNRISLKVRTMVPYYRIFLLTALLAVFYVGFMFVYRDGKRQAMTEPMGDIFPALTGIYSDTTTVALYRDLKTLAEKYGPNFKVLPAFPQANYLTGTPPPLPLDWVVNRETNSDNKLIFKDLNDKNPIVFLEKTYLEVLPTDPELTVSRT
ncbi:MAG: hypothetical protein RIQ78_447, partial [Bacteroidota bacterium]